MPATDSHDGQVHGAAPPPPDATMVTGGASTSSADVFKPGDVVGGSYQVLHALGRGAMGMVYKVKHISMDAEYALKVLSTEFLNDNAMLRFQNEAQALAKLNHPNVIAVYNFGLHNDRLPFYVMDFLSGDNLLDKLDAHGPMPVSVALPVFIEVCAGLSYAHRKGILHRDVKPANFVMLNVPDVRGARVKVVDFGLVKFAEELKPDIQKLTAIGEVCGSPSYMSPEQSSGQKIDPRSDIYSLGCSLFQALTGKLPFRGRSATETMMMQHEAEVPTLASQGDGRTYPEDLDRVVAKMMAKAPMDRYQTMDAVAQDLRNILDGRPLGAPALSAGQDFGTGSYDVFSPDGRSIQSRTSGPIAGGSMERSQSVRRYENNEAPAAREEMNLHTTARYSKSDADAAARGRSAQNQAGGRSATVKKAIVIALISIGVLALIGGGVYFLKSATQPVVPHEIVVVNGVKKIKEAPSEISANIDDATQALDSFTGPNLELGTRGKDIAEKIQLTADPYFGQTIQVRGRPYIEFHFPQLIGEQELGWISTSLADRHRINGTLRFPKGQKLYIAPLPISINVPKFFTKFRPGEIHGLFMPGSFASDDLLLAALHVPVKQVTIDNCKPLTAKIVPALSRAKLTTLHANNNSIDGRDFAKADFYQDLDTLEVMAISHVTPILQKLSGSKKLEVLNVSCTKLGAADYELLSNIPGIKRLNISGNKISSRDLLALSKLPHLEELCAYMVSMPDSSYIDALSHFHSLRTIAICTGYIKPQDVQLLKTKCPKLMIQNVDANQMDKNTMAPKLRSESEQ